MDSRRGQGAPHRLQGTQGGLGPGAELARPGPARGRPHRLTAPELPPRGDVAGAARALDGRRLFGLWMGQGPAGQGPREGAGARWSRGAVRRRRAPRGRRLIPRGGGGGGAGVWRAAGSSVARRGAQLPGTLRVKPERLLVKSGWGWLSRVSTDTVHFFPFRLHCTGLVTFTCRWRFSLLK